jgi:uncharacterized membrane protein
MNVSGELQLLSSMLEKSTTVYVLHNFVTLAYMGRPNYVNYPRLCLKIQLYRKRTVSEAMVRTLLVMT